MKIKINFKERLKNKVFLLSALTLIITFAYQILGLFGIVPAISEETIVNVLTIGVNFLAMLGVLVDPTTAGMSDSERALTYGTSSDVRVLESKTPKIDSYKTAKEHYSIEAHPVSEKEKVPGEKERSN